MITVGRRTVSTFASREQKLVTYRLEYVRVTTCPIIITGQRARAATLTSTHTCARSSLKLHTFVLIALFPYFILHIGKYIMLLTTSMALVTLLHTTRLILTMEKHWYDKYFGQMLVRMFGRTRG